jgi:hypothetical protein
MNIFDFITQDEMDDLPDDDPEVAFATFVRLAQGRLTDRVRELEQNNQEPWTEISEARYGFTNVVIAAGKKYEIEPFSSLVVPRLKNFGQDEHLQFKADLDHYLTQLLLNNSSKAKRSTVQIEPPLKSTIRTYIFHLRDIIEKADDLDEAKRASLLRRISEFEAELEKKRLSLLAVTVLAITFLSAPGGIGATAEQAAKLITNIMRSVGDAKAADDENRSFPSTELRKSITGPRDPSLEEDTNTINRRARSDDDEIPF